jgi:transposase
MEELGYSAADIARQLGVATSSITRAVAKTRESATTQARNTNTSKKCLEIIVEPFDDGWPEYEETFIDVQAS